MTNERQFVVLSIILLVLVLMDCEKSINKYEDQTVILEAGKESLNIKNKSSESLFYTALEKELSTRIDIRVNCDNTNYIEGDGIKIIPYDNVMGFKPGATIVIYTWLCDESGSPNQFQSYQLKSS